MVVHLNSKAAGFSHPNYPTRGTRGLAPNRFFLPSSCSDPHVTSRIQHDTNTCRMGQLLPRLDQCVRYTPHPIHCAVGYATFHLAPHVGCRRVVFLPKRRHSVSCRRHVADMFQSCRRHKKMSCRLECLNDTTFDDMSGNSGDTSATCGAKPVHLSEVGIIHRELKWQSHFTNSGAVTRGSDRWPMCGTAAGGIWMRKKTIFSFWAQLDSPGPSGRIIVIH